MPDVRNCKRCGKVYTYIGGAPLCIDCRDEDEKCFRRVKDYLYDNPGATVSKVSTDLEISVERIKSYLREGRLEIVGGESNLMLECESCGKAIRSGRYCDECMRALNADMVNQVKKMRETLSHKTDQNKTTAMRYLNKIDDKKSDTD